MRPQLKGIFLLFSLIVASSPSIVDLHSHSSFSDGSDFAVDLVHKAHEKGIKFLAITDHDQLKYSLEASKLAIDLGIELIQGVEISCEWKFHFPQTLPETKVHLLGYFTQSEPDTELFRKLEEVQRMRAARNDLILEKLQKEFGILVSMEEIKRFATSPADLKERILIGRPHIAKYLVAHGYAASIQDAFIRFLSDEALKLEPWSLSLQEAIHLLYRHGAVPVLAHPRTLSLPPPIDKEGVETIGAFELKRELQYLINEEKVPLQGIEAFSSKHTQKESSFYVKLASDLNLIVTGGSDYHGMNKDNVDLATFGGASEVWKQKGADAVMLLKRTKSVVQSSLVLAQLKEKQAVQQQETLMNMKQALPLTQASVKSRSRVELINKPHRRQLQADLMLILSVLIQYCLLGLSCWAFVLFMTAEHLSNKCLMAASIRHYIKTSSIYRVLCEPLDSSTSFLPTKSDSSPSSFPTTFLGTFFAKSFAWAQKLKFFLCFFGLQISYISWGWLQERIMTREYLTLNGSATDRFRHSDFLVFCNRLAGIIVAVSVTIYRVHHQQQQQHQQSISIFASVRRAPPIAYTFASISNVLSSWLQYEALKFISFPLQVLSKSTKILCTMLMGIFVKKERYAWQEYFLAIMTAVGLFLFRINETTTNITTTNNKNYTNDESNNEFQIFPFLSFSTTTATFLVGCFLLLLYMITDSFTSNYQSLLFQQHKINSIDMMLGTNIGSCCWSLLLLLFGGHFSSCILFLLQHQDCWRHVLMMSFSSSLGQLFIFWTIEYYGPVTFASSMTLRQFFTVCLSIVSFGHSLNTGSVLGLALVFASLLGKILQEYTKAKVKEQQKMRAKEVANATRSS